MVADRGTGAVMKLSDFADQVLSGFFGAAPELRQITAAELATSAAARREYQLQLGALREQDAALTRMAQDMAAGRNLSAADVRSLPHNELQRIRDGGDGPLNDLVREREQKEKRERDDYGGRGRER
jgi:hypothetical protein